MLGRLREPWTDKQAERRLGAVACLVGLAVVAMVVFVAIKAWPTLVHNGGVLWLGPGGNPDTQLGAMIKTGQHPPPEAYHLRAWPLLWGTLLTSGAAVAGGLAFSLAASIFIVEFAPTALRNAV